MKTQRITLEITYDSSAILPLEKWDWEELTGESVSIINVTEPTSVAEKPKD